MTRSESFYNKRRLETTNLINDEKEEKGKEDKSKKGKTMEDTMAKMHITERVPLSRNARAKADKTKVLTLSKGKGRAGKPFQRTTDSETLSIGNPTGYRFPVRACNEVDEVILRLSFSPHCIKLSHASKLRQITSSMRRAAKLSGSLNCALAITSNREIYFCTSYIFYYLRIL